MRKTRDLFFSISESLKHAAGDLSGREAETIFCSILNKSRSQLFLDFGSPITKEQAGRISSVAEKRLAGTPLPYLLKSSYFYNRDIYIDNSVHIPRPDTEILVETVLDREKKGRLFFLDLGTGSGNIPAALCLERASWKCLCLDISFNALRTAEKNLDNRCMPVCCDRFTAVKNDLKADFIVSNPPYIPDREIDNLEPSVKNHEPLLSLAGGKDGLDFIRYISENGKDFLKPGGRCYCETGYDQGKDAHDIFLKNGWKNIDTLKDLAGRERVVRAIC